jgi:Mg-chelatase subunit ChlI
MNNNLIFPFTAIVGQEMMLRSLILNAVDPRIGGVLIRGERGTAKSTAARALAALLPDIEVVKGCRFACDPAHPSHFCTECQERLEAGEDPLPTETRKTPFINLPVSATEDRVVGTLDIERAIQLGQRHFEPGVLAAANRGMLYIDEVNLLDDHVVDILLDSAAMGVNVVEREGISFSHPARFILVGTMNPEEGDLRPQLLDRFAFSVDIHGILDKAQRVEIMRRNIAFEADPAAFQAKWAPKEQELSDKIKAAEYMLDEVGYTQRDLTLIAELTSSMEVDGHRSDMVILKGARAQAAFDGRRRISPVDIGIAAELALPHRVKAGPFRKSGVGIETLNTKIDGLKALSTVTEYPEEDGDEGATPDDSDKKKAIP